MPETAETLALADRAAAALRKAGGHDPEAVAFAPGRVNLIGDHTDYNNGFVMPLAIDVGCVAAASTRGPAGLLTATAVDLGERAEIDAKSRITPEAAASEPAWFRYVAGTFEGFREAAGLPTLAGVELAVTSSVPAGSGLSSSAALEVSVATCLESLTGVEIDPIAKARLCQRAEHRFAGVPCGLMDQLASTLGELDHALRIDCRTVEVTPCPLPPPTDAALIIIDSMVKHDNASGTYAARRAACERAAARLGLDALRDLREGWEDRADGVLTEEERTAAQHVFGENRRVTEFAAAVSHGDLAAAGALMTGSHRSLAELYRVSCAELDLLVDLLIDRPGVHGARLSGAGLGGWVVALCDAGSAGAAVESVTSGFAARQGVTPRWRMVSPMPGARRLDA